MSHLLYPLSGLFIGFLVGLTGVGGGSLMTPLLVLLFGVHPTTAVGSDLLYAAATKVVGTGVHGTHGTVDWRIVRRLAAGSVPATVLALGVTALWPQNNSNGHALTVALGVVLLLTAVLLMFRGPVVRFFAAWLGEMSPRRVLVATVVTGAVLGFLVTITSVGAGAIGVPALLVLYPRTAVGRLVGSDIAHAVPLTLLAGFGRWILGDVDFGLVGSLLIGSVPGVILGSVLSFRLPDRGLRIALALVLAATSLRMLG